MSLFIHEFRGHFQLWTYDVSHGRLLFRRNKAESDQTRMDLLFVDTVFVQIRTGIHSFFLEEMTEAEASREIPAAHSGIPTTFKRYRLRATDHTGYIVAGDVLFHEDDGTYAQPSEIYKPGGIVHALGLNGYDP